MNAPLEFGLAGELYIREERLAADGDACRLMYVSDIHLRAGRSERLSEQIIQAARRCEPDAVLLGGDLVDRQSELQQLSELVGALREFAPLFAIGGNHDQSVGMDRVEQAVIEGDGEWIHDRCVNLSHRSRVIAIAGPEANGVCDGDARVLCAHNPRIWKKSRDSGFDLVLAGHLHGCQVVAFEYRDRLFPGAWFYPYTYLSHQSGSTRLVVSRGVSDLVPIRWRCPREVVLCHV